MTQRIPNNTMSSSDPGQAKLFGVSNANQSKSQSSAAVPPHQNSSYAQFGAVPPSTATQSGSTRFWGYSAVKLEPESNTWSASPSAAQQNPSPTPQGLDSGKHQTPFMAPVKPNEARPLPASRPLSTAQQLLEAQLEKECERLTKLLKLRRDILIEGGSSKINDFAINDQLKSHLSTFPVLERRWELLRFEWVSMLRRERERRFMLSGGTDVMDIGEEIAAKTNAPALGAGEFDQLYRLVHAAADTAGRASKKRRGSNTVMEDGDNGAKAKEIDNQKKKSTGLEQENYMLRAENDVFKIENRMLKEKIAGLAKEIEDLKKKDGQLATGVESKLRKENRNLKAKVSGLKGTIAALERD